MSAAEEFARAGWVPGHAPEGTRAERLKYRTEDGEWVPLHRPERAEPEQPRRWVSDSVAEFMHPPAPQPPRRWDLSDLS